MAVLDEGVIGGHPRFVDTWMVSTWSVDGHFHGTRNGDHAGQKATPTHPQATAPNGGGEAPDRRGDAGRGRTVARVARAHGVNANQVFQTNSHLASIHVTVSWTLTLPTLCQHGLARTLTKQLQMFALSRIVKSRHDGNRPAMTL